MFKKFIAIFATFVIVLSIGLAMSSKKAAAVTASAWQAGRIMDNGVFTNSGAMSVDQIQNFLNSKVGTGGFDSIPGQCDTNGVRNAQPYTSASRADYAASLGRPTKFTCLNGYFEVPKTSPGPGVPASNYGGAPIPAGAESAAQLIWDASQRYNISPKVLLVTIQKESAGPLTTDDWPFQKQYTYAMGAHCPDSGPGGSANCDTNYAGFSLQISESAALFRWYLDNMSQPWWSYKKPGNNSILYNPDTNCGSSNIYIANSATAALYTYTPYQPNQSALNNMYGLGDSCSAYGNRNFWRIYYDWFGSVYDGDYQAQAYGQSPNRTINPGGAIGIYFKFRNIGVASWKDDTNASGTFPVHLATSCPVNRSSDFSASWPSAARPLLKFSQVFEADGTTLAADQHTVYPGQIGLYEFSVTASIIQKFGTYTECFQPVLDGSPQWNMGATVSTDINVVNPYIASIYYGDNSSLTLPQNTSKNVRISYRNSGTATWKDDASIAPGEKPVHLATSYPVNRSSAFSATWPARERPGLTFSKVYESDGATLAANQHMVAPGQIATYDFTLNSPNNLSPNTYNEAFQLVLEGGSPWDLGNIVTFLPRVTPNTYNPSVYYGSDPYFTLPQNTSKNVRISYRNSGTATWKDDASIAPGEKPVHLATSYPVNRSSAFSATWPARERPGLTFSKVYESDGATLAANQHMVAPGQIATYDFTLNSPNNLSPNTYNEAFQLVLEGGSPWDLGNIVTFLPRVTP